MPITVKNMSEVLGKDVFTNRGAYAGRVADVKLNLAKFRIDSFMLDVGRNSFLSGVIGKRKGIIVNFKEVDSIGDVVIIKHFSTAAVGGEEEPKEQASPVASWL